MFLGRAHTAGDIVAFVPDEQVMFTGDIVEYHSACYCGDGHFNDWGGTLDRIAAFRPAAIAPGRGDALVGDKMVRRSHREYPRFCRKHLPAGGHGRGPWWQPEGRVGCGARRV